MRLKGGMEWGLVKGRDDQDEAEQDREMMEGSSLNARVAPLKECVRMYVCTMIQAGLKMGVRLEQRGTSCGAWLCMKTTGRGCGRGYGP